MDTSAKRFLVALLAVLLALTAAELLGRWLLSQTPSPALRRVHPYLGFGSTYTWQEGLGTDSEGPSTFGYREERAIYLFPFEDSVPSLATRFEFLFQDRGGLANQTGGVPLLDGFLPLVVP